MKGNYFEKRGRFAIFSDEDLKKINQRIAKGETYASIAKDYGVHINNFYYWQEKGKLDKKERKTSNSNLALAKNMKRKGATYKQIAKELDINLSTVFRLKKKGKLP